MSRVFWRLSVARRQSEAFSGTRSRARWSTAATHPVYTASSVALAALERLLYAQFQVQDGAFQTHHLFRIEIPEGVPVETLAAPDLPDLWYEMVAPPDPLNPPTPLQLLGDAWYRRAEAAVLIVPSAHAWEETNALLSPDHSAFAELGFTYIREYRFDQRYGRRR